MIFASTITSLPLWITAWIFIIFGIAVLAILIIYTKYGREISIKLSAVTIIFASIFLAFGLHFFLLTVGIY